jgi:hypothetical protein
MHFTSFRFKRNSALLRYNHTINASYNQSTYNQRTYMQHIISATETLQSTSYKISRHYVQLYMCTISASSNQFSRGVIYNFLIYYVSISYTRVRQKGRQRRAWRAKRSRAPGKQITKHREAIFPLMNTCSFKKRSWLLLPSVAELDHFYAAPAPAPGENFDAAPALAAPAPTLLYSKAKFL